MIFQLLIWLLILLQSGSLSSVYKHGILAILLTPKYAILFITFLRLILFILLILLSVIFPASSGGDNKNVIDGWYPVGQ